jgi:2-polyprenyl-3-methyl-5-hydroxy-6-metoxy-1,4-benzoquinol methylase
MNHFASDAWAYSHQGSRNHLSREALEQGFGRVARYYSALLGHRLALREDLEILDIPCGEGEISYWLRSQGFKCLRGFDLDSSRIESGRRLGLPLHVGDAFGVLRQTRDNSLGAVFSLNFLEHLEKHQVIEFMTSTKSWL